MDALSPILQGLLPLRTLQHAAEAAGLRFRKGGVLCLALAHAVSDSKPPLRPQKPGGCAASHHFGHLHQVGPQDPVFPSSIGTFGTLVIGPPPVAGPRPPQSRALSFSAPPGSDTDPGSLSARHFWGVFAEKGGGAVFLGSPSWPMSRPVEIHDRRLGGQARDPPTP